MATDKDTTIELRDLTDSMEAKLSALHALLDAARVASGNIIEDRARVATGAESRAVYDLCDDTLPELLFHAMNLIAELRQNVEAVWSAHRAEASRPRLVQD